MVDVTGPVASTELAPQVVKAMRKDRESMYAERLLHDVDFRDLVDEHELTHVESLLDCVDLLLSDWSYNFRSGRENVNFHSDVLAS